MKAVAPVAGADCAGGCAALYRLRMIEGMYLDNNATTLIEPRVVEAMAACYGAANPASQHAPGRAARRLLEDAREQVAEILGARSGMHRDHVIFTSGGTEANNLAIHGLTSAAIAAGGPAKLVISAIEHPSIEAPAALLEATGTEVMRLAVSSDGVVDLTQAEAAIAGAGVVSVMLGNNETGVLQPVQQIAALCADHQAVMHTDAVQAAGKVSVNFQKLGVGAMTVAAHKFHGPRGIGALILRGDTVINPTLRGGFQQMGVRPGTENVVLAVGMAKALQLWHEDAVAHEAAMREFRDDLEQRLRAGDPTVIINGSEAPRLPHTSSIAFPGIDRQVLVMALDRAGLACSTGSACASGSSEPSPVLTAMGLSEDVISSSIRISCARLTEPDESSEAADLILKTTNNLRSHKTARN